MPQHLPLHSAAPGFARSQAPIHYAPDLTVEPRHLRIHVRPDPANRSLFVRVTILAVVRTTGPAVLRLDAVEFTGLQVYDPQGRALSWVEQAEQITLSWAGIHAVGSELSAVLSYRVIQPRTGVFFSHPTAKDPTLPVFTATDHETERARYWLACVDHPNVRTSLDIALEVPEHWQAIANGSLDRTETLEGGMVVHHWVLQSPCPAYLICFVAGELVSAKGGQVDGIPIDFYGVPPSIDEDLLRSFGRTAELLRWITTFLRTPYPFPKYSQFAVPAIGGAMENISLVSWDDMFVADQRLHAELGWRIDLINLHEMAHTWFGDAVVCRDFAHSWLKESWAVYMEAVWLQDTEGEETAHLHLWEARAAYTEESDTRYARPIATRRFDASWDLFDRHLYPGGAWRIHMLRNMLGDEVFWAAVRDYLRSNEGRVVETDDFRRCLERWSGRSLAAFFDQWIFSPGYPKLSAEWTWEAGEGRLQVRQTQVDTAKGIGTFPLNLPIQVQHPDGQWTAHQLRLEGDKAELRLSLPTPPLQVLIDPEATTLHMLQWNPGIPMLQRGLSHPQAWVRVEAARHLAATARPTALHLIRAAAEQEPHWMARRIFARLLGNAGTREAARQLLAWLPNETDARVLPTLFEALARLRAPEIAPAICTWLTGNGLGWMATAAALHALGAQRDPETEGQLIEASQADSWWGWVQKGAATGLGELRTPGAIQRLIAMLHAPEVQRPGRLAAIEALGPAARNLPPHERRAVWEHLGELVEDPDYAARMATARSLAALGDPEGARWIDQIAASVASQDRPRVEKLAERLRAQTPGAPSDMVQRLEQQLKALQDRLERLEATKEKPT